MIRAGVGAVAVAAVPVVSTGAVDAVSGDAAGAGAGGRGAFCAVIVLGGPGRAGVVGAAGAVEGASPSLNSGTELGDLVVGLRLRCLICVGFIASRYGSLAGVGHRLVGAVVLGGLILV